MRFMHFRSEGRIWMGQKQAIESAHDEDQPTFDELGVLPRFLAKLLALEQVRDDGTDPLAVNRRPNGTPYRRAKGTPCQDGGALM